MSESAEKDLIRPVERLNDHPAYERFTKLPSEYESFHPDEVQELPYSPYSLFEAAIRGFKLEQVEYTLRHWPVDLRNRRPWLLGFLKTAETLPIVNDLLNILWKHGIMVTREDIKRTQRPASDEALFRLLPERFLFHQSDGYIKKDQAHESARYELPRSLDQRNMQLATTTSVKRS